jgi:hypothetical protein
MGNAALSGQRALMMRFELWLLAALFSMPLQGCVESGTSRPDLPPLLASAKIPDPVANRALVSATIERCKSETDKNTQVRLSAKELEQHCDCFAPLMAAFLTQQSADALTNPAAAASPLKFTDEISLLRVGFRQCPTLDDVFLKSALRPGADLPPFPGDEPLAKAFAQQCEYEAATKKQLRPEESRAECECVTRVLVRYLPQEIKQGLLDRGTWSGTAKSPFRNMAEAVNKELKVKCGLVDPKLSPLFSK